MHDILVLILRYVRGTWRYRWWMLGIAWVVSLVGWAVVARLPDQYKATAQVYVDTSSILQPYLQGLAIRTTDTERKISLMTRTLLSQTNMEKVMRMTDLDLLAQTAADREQLISDLKKKITFRGTRRENLFTISFEDNSPELAKLVVKSLLTIFMEGNLGEARKDQDSATRFLEQQIAEYERRMREAEREISTFKQKNLNLLPIVEGSQSYFDRMRDAKQRIDEARLSLKLEEGRLETLRAQVEGEVPEFGLGWELPQEVQQVVADTTSIDRRIDDTEARLDELLLRFTDQHPDVVGARKLLDKFKQDRDAAIVAAERNFEQSGGLEAYSQDTNPVYQQLKLALANVETEVAVKRSLLTEYEAQVEELENRVDEITTLQAQGKQLNRQYESLKKSHAALGGRLEKARLGRKADTSADSVEFRVIDPPRAPAKPSGPNRVLLSSGVLAVGLLAGLGVAFLMSQIRPTFDERQVLNDALGLPVLGSVNMIWTSDQIKARRVRNVSFVASLTSLMVIFASVLVLYQFDIDILPRLAKSLNLT